MPQTSPAARAFVSFVLRYANEVVKFSPSYTTLRRAPWATVSCAGTSHQEATMETLVKYNWQEAVLDALMELRPEHLQEKLEIADRRIAARWLGQPDVGERSALRDAFHLLRVLFPEAH